ncbi:Cys-rich peptide radical SAM maturase CcpM [Paenibacillus kribbensis]|uniref:Cys-rich peptide radical SAM maturase CcpM n=1 Tax=Paenibacillus kribbensis TaxID=172713 RepID=UPI0008386537|nr:Cys-rich peptide radical SAM maturase CcpM [Paenibacillus kribbensis]
MSGDTPLIYLFRTVQACYIYDTNTNELINVDPVTYESVKNFMEGNNKTTPELDALRKKGYLTGERDFIMVHPADELLESILDRKLYTMALQLTQNCNLRCKYCVYSGSYTNRTHTNKRMSREVAFKAIDFLILHSADSSTINLGFYGGEPLLEFPLIRDCIEYAKKNIFGKELTFSITTNATLFSPEVIDFLSENSVNITISLDGPELLHDKNRRYGVNGRGTFADIMNNIEMIKERHPDYVEKINFNTVIDPLNDYSCVSDFFGSYHTVKEFLVTSAIINDIYRNDSVSFSENYQKNVNYELFKMYLWKLGKLDERHVSKLVLPTFSQIKENVHKRMKLPTSKFKKDHPSGPCVPGAQRLFVDVEGQLYPCERVSESSQVMRIGDVYEGFDFEKVRSILNLGKLTEEACRSCWAFRMCNQCAAAADGIEELSGPLRMELCQNVKNYVADILMTYCTLRELGCDFEDQAETEESLNEEKSSCFSL